MKIKAATRKKIMNKFSRAGNMSMKDFASQAYGRLRAFQKAKEAFLKKLKKLFSNLPIFILLPEGA